MLINYFKTPGVIKNIPSQSYFTFDILMPIIEDRRSNEDNGHSESWSNLYPFKEKC